MPGRYHSPEAQERRFAWSMPAAFAGQTLIGDSEPLLEYVR
jgi:hypothetical protein